MRVTLAVLAVVSFALVCHAQDTSSVPAVSLQNPGFESPSILGGASTGASPDNWFYFCSNDEKKSGITDGKKKEGAQSFVFKAQSEPNAFQGVAQMFPVKAGGHYTFSANITGEANDPLVGKGYGQVSLEWKNPDGSEISRTYGPTWDLQLSNNRWEKFTVEDDAPEGAVNASAVITFFSVDSAAVGTFYADECELSSR